MFDSTFTASEQDFDALLIGALNRLDFEKAQEAMLGLIRLRVGAKESWDSPQYAASKVVQLAINLDHHRDERLTFFALDTLRDRYFLKLANGAICETPQSFFARVATGVAMGDKTAAEVESNPVILKEVTTFARRLYGILSQQHALFATPILTNAGTNRGHLISCFLNASNDSIVGIFGETLTENAVLAQGGGGIGTYWGKLCGQGASLSRGGKSSGPIPFLKVMDSETLAVHQAGARRGAAAAYMPIDHPDIEDFIDMRRPEGAEERRCQNINHGVCITDEFMEAVKARKPWDLVCPHSGKVMKTVDAYGLWKRLLMTRVMTGEPYLLFKDAVNRAQPQAYKNLGLEVETSNLCVEITLPTKAGSVEAGGRTAICCLASVNFATYSEWQHDQEDLTYCMVKGLDNVLDHFIRFAGQGYEKSVHGATRGRDIGLGAMGWFDYLQQRGIPFESIEARAHNNMRFKEFGTFSDKASRRLAVERGPAPDTLAAAPWYVRLAMTVVMALGLNKSFLGSWLVNKLMPSALCFRNVNRQALAPTATIGIIAGASPAIEPPAGNVFTQKTLSGSFLVRNPALDRLVKTKYAKFNTYDNWSSITENGGSVQHLDWMDDDDKKLFKTAYELNQREIVQQAADRQRWISQAQSLNLFFAPGSSAKISAAYLHDVHWLAWETGVKSLYYVRSESVLKVASVESKAKVARVVDSMSAQECAVCQ